MVAHGAADFLERPAVVAQLQHGQPPPGEGRRVAVQLLQRAVPLGPRFPALTDAYDPELADLARAAARRTGLRLHEGVYVMLAGPSYETRAELRMLRGLGADAVGMSTVLEVIVARHAGVRVLAISLVTNKATPDVAEGATHEEVIEVGRVGAANLATLFGSLLPEIA